MKPIKQTAKEQNSMEIQLQRIVDQMFLCTLKIDYKRQHEGIRSKLNCY